MVAHKNIYRCIGYVDDPLPNILYTMHTLAIKRGPTTEYRPTPHFRLNFPLRSNVYSNMHPCVAALEKVGSNGWFMRTELCQTAAVSLMPYQAQKNDCALS